MNKPNVLANRVVEEERLGLATGHGNAVIDFTGDYLAAITTGSAPALSFPVVGCPWADTIELIPIDSDFVVLISFKTLPESKSNWERIFAMGWIEPKKGEALNALKARALDQGGILSSISFSHWVRAQIVEKYPKLADDVDFKNHLRWLREESGTETAEGREFIAKHLKLDISSWNQAKWLCH